MLPSQTEMNLIVLKTASDGLLRPRKELQEEAIASCKPTQEELDEVTPGGTYVFSSRTGWAISNLSNAGLLESPSPRMWRISPAGLDVLAGNPDAEELASIMRSRMTRPKKQAKCATDASTANIDKAENDKSNDDKVDVENGSVIRPPLTRHRHPQRGASPDELITQADKTLRAALRDELMQRILGIPGRDGDTAFEQIVCDLLVHMGYGEGRVTKASRDEGIDGIVKTDPLGFDPVLIQAKRWSPDNKVGRKEVQAFAGALSAITRGAFITTSTFTSEAVEYAKRYPHADIVLIDGQRLTDLMIDYELGVTTERVIKIKHVDSDYFERWE